MPHPTLTRNTITHPAASPARPPSTTRAKIGVHESHTARALAALQAVIGFVFHETAPPSAEGPLADSIADTSVCPRCPACQSPLATKQFAR